MEYYSLIPMWAITLRVGIMYYVTFQSWSFHSVWSLHGLFSTESCSIHCWGTTYLLFSSAVHLSWKTSELIQCLTLIKELLWTFVSSGFKGVITGNHMLRDHKKWPSNQWSRAISQLTLPPAMFLWPIFLRSDQHLTMLLAIFQFSQLKGLYLSLIMALFCSSTIFSHEYLFLYSFPICKLSWHTLRCMLVNFVHFIIKFF